MSKEITKDYMYLIVKEGNILKTKEEDISLNNQVEKMLSQFLQNKEDKLKKTEIKGFIKSVKEIYPDFFNDRNYAIGYCTSFEELGIPNSCSKREFKEEIYNYIYANALEFLYYKYNRDRNIIAYSHRIRGWKEFHWKLDEKFEFNVSTNLAYGNSSYFDMTLYWKKIPIVNYLHIVFYRFFGESQINRVTESYNLNPSQWKRCFDNTVYYVNTFYKAGENHFVKKYLENTYTELINKLELNLNTNLFCVLTSYDIDELFIRENYFIDLYYKNTKCPNILIDNSNNRLKEIIDVCNDNNYLQNFLESKCNYVSRNDVDNVLEKFILNYINLPNLQKKAKTYKFMLDLLDIIENGYSNQIIDNIFKWLYSNLKTTNNYLDDKFLYMENDDYQLQIKRSEQCVLTIKIFNDASDNETKYIYSKHKNNLISLIKVLMEQNLLLISKLSNNEKLLKDKIIEVTKNRDVEYKILEQKKSYKNHLIYTEYFQVLNKYLSKLLVIKKTTNGRDYEINQEIYNNILIEIKNLKLSAYEKNFDLGNILNLVCFDLGNNNNRIYYGSLFYEFNMAELENKYRNENKKIYKDILNSTKSVLENYHKLMKNLMCDWSYFNSYLERNNYSKIIVDKVMNIANFCCKKELSSENYTTSLNDYVKLYEKSIKLNSEYYIKNFEEYENESVKYNSLVKELSSLEQELHICQNKIKSLKEYNNKLNI